MQDRCRVRNFYAVLSLSLIGWPPDLAWHACSVNDSKYGLQAGVFTHDLDKAWFAFEKLDVGGVVVNHVPSIRVDAQVAHPPPPTCSAAKLIFYAHRRFHRLCTHSTSTVHGEPLHLVRYWERQTHFLLYPVRASLLMAAI